MPSTRTFALPKPLPPGQRASWLAHSRRHGPRILGGTIITLVEACESALQLAEDHAGHKLARGRQYDFTPRTEPARYLILGDDGRYHAPVTGRVERQHLENQRKRAVRVDPMVKR
jgi:hypothetical protein